MFISLFGINNSCITNAQLGADLYVYNTYLDVPVKFTIPKLCKVTVTSDGNGTASASVGSGMTETEVVLSATVNMGSNVERIGNSAFKGCVALKKITIGEKVNYIGKKAFYGCSKLKTITIKTLLLTKSNIGSSAFKKINGKATFKCPKEKKKEYKKILKKKGAPKGAKYK